MKRYPQNLTAELIGGRTDGRAHRWIARLDIVTDRLLAAYGLPKLGNFRDPVREIFYIMLSARTTDAQYRETHRRLFFRFPTLAALARARLAAVRACILSGGLDTTRARHSRAAARRLLQLGDNPAKKLRRMDAAEAYRTILDLPGMGIKSTLCVLMYSLDFDVFPVDINVQRIAERLGALPSGISHPQAQKKMGPMVPVGRSKALHIGMVVHGRKVCLPRKPRCGECVLRDLCRYAKKHGSDGPTEEVKSKRSE